MTFGIYGMILLLPLPWQSSGLRSGEAWRRRIDWAVARHARIRRVCFDMWVLHHLRSPLQAEQDRG